MYKGVLASNESFGLPLRSSGSLGTPSTPSPVGTAGGQQMAADIRVPIFYKSLKSKLIKDAHVGPVGHQSEPFAPIACRFHDRHVSFLNQVLPVPESLSPPRILHSVISVIPLILY